jgi:hypothetical protein
MEKLILIFYIIGVFFLSVVYKPLVLIYRDGLTANIGHHFIFDYPSGYYIVDSHRIFVELVALTMMTAAAILFFKRK